jgi:hypothetical protein
VHCRFLDDGDQPSRTTFRISLLIVARWVSAFGFVACLAFGLVFAYLTIVTGRWLFGRKGTVKSERIKSSMKIGIRQNTPLGDQADSLLSITAIIDITEEKIRNVIAERAADQKIPSRDSKLASHFDARTSFPYESSAAPKHIAHRVSDGLEAFASADLAHLHDVVKDGMMLA